MMDSLIFGLLVTAIGIGIVFFGLVVLIGLIKLISLATASMGKKKEDARPVPRPAPAPVPAPAAEEAPAAADDDALIAVITAAIASMLDDGSAFVVRKVRRVSSAPAWNRAGREEQIYSRF